MKKNGTTFYCFSPPVMLATFAVEILLLLYVFVRYKLTPTTRLVAATLVLLATFQYAEFHVCESIGTTEFYSRLGYVAITLLPPVGIHLVTRIAGRDPKKLIGTAYASGLAFALTFGLSPSAFDSYACSGNYAVFQLANNLGNLYFLYYYLWMFIGIALCIRYSAFANKDKRDALIYQAWGYVSFILPTGVVNAINPQTIEGIPSIMCGFAVIYALILALKIVPKVIESKEPHKTAST
jgi:hypothetical protein